MASALIDRLKATNLNVDHREVLTALDKIKVSSQQELGDAMRSDVNRVSEDLAFFRQEVLESNNQTHSDSPKLLLEEVRVLQRAVAEAKQMQKLDHSLVMSHLKRLEPDHPAMASALIDRLKATNLNVDHREVLAAMDKIKVSSQQELGDSVLEKSSRSTLHAYNNEALKEVRSSNGEPDSTPLLKAVQSMEVNLARATEAISDLRNELLATNAKLRPVPPVQVIQGSLQGASQVEQRIRNSIGSTMQCLVGPTEIKLEGLNSVGNSVALRALGGLNTSPREPTPRRLPAQRSLSSPGVERIPSHSDKKVSELLRRHF